MPLKEDLEITAITLPLDVVLDTVRAARGNLPAETKALLQMEIVSVLASIPRLEDEVVAAIFKDAFE